MRWSMLVEALTRRGADRAGVAWATSSLLAAALLVGSACAGDGDDGPRPLDRIDGPAQVDPEFRDGGSDGRIDPDG